MKKAQQTLWHLRYAGILVILGSTGTAQTVTGRLLGTIQDPSQAGVPAAQVRITNQDTGISSTYRTDSTGSYLGTYAVSYDDTSILWVWDDRLNWSASSGIPRHIVNGSWTYELPVGRNRRFQTGGSKAADLIAGGWSINGITILRTGVPLSVGVKNNLLNTGTSNVANQTCSSLSYPKLVSQWFDTSCFADPTTPYAWGNARKGAVWGPGVINFDLSAFKRFPLPKERSIEFRAEFFNALNNHHFANPDTNRANGTYGQITNTALPPREMQMGLKLIF